MLKGRTIVVTGAARGVGLTIATACAAQGARLILGDILEEPGHAAAETLKAAGAEARFIPLDLAEPSSIQAFADTITSQEAAVHGLVNNGAIATNVGGAAFEDIPIELWDSVMRVNVRGLWLMTRAMAPLLVDNEARIVNMASDTALWGPPRLLAYVTSKGAVISMTRALARELGPRGIGVVALAPGIMRNEATDYVPRERHELNERGRAVPGPMVPDDIAEAAMFLLSKGALPLTGQVVPVNSGFVYT